MPNFETNSATGYVAISSTAGLQSTDDGFAIMTNGTEVARLTAAGLQLTGLTLTPLAEPIETADAPGTLGQIGIYCGGGNGASDLRLHHRRLEESAAGHHPHVAVGPA